MKKWFSLTMFLTFLLTGVGIFLVKFHSQPSQKEAPPPKTGTNPQQQVIGFYPYWNLNQINEDSFKNLTSVYYFAISVNQDGTFDKNDLGWIRLSSDSFNKLRNLASTNHVRFGVTIINPVPNKTSSSSVVSLMKTYDFTDLNLDLENAAISNEYITNLTTSVKKELPEAKISVDLLSDAASKINPNVDNIIIMAYDYNRLNAISAGPVSPQPQVLKSVEEFLDRVPPEKLILGVPLYGYEWPTLDAAKNSYVISSSRGPELSTYKRSLKTIKENAIVVDFDDQTKSPWFSYYDETSATWRQVWFENERSLNYKMKIITDYNLAGTAIFALGYEGSFDLLSKLNF
ncbi:hypothetical protein HY310_02225 [Candidatus Microgenomates bacterium]|nr:hypothetical protein [Candidatus Microgenomates bacterium]